MKRLIAFSALAVGLMPLVYSQSLKVDHYTPSEIIAKSHELEPRAQGPEGVANTTLKEYPNHHTMVVLRHKDGAA